MTFKEYQELARRTSRFSCEPHIENNVLMASLGLSGEVGELLNYIKKGIFHGHNIDKEVLTEEIGDVLWYVAEMCSAYNIDMQYAGNVNLLKLRQRYPNGFSSEASINRSAE